MSFAFNYIKKYLERKKSKADLSPEETAEKKRRRAYRWKIIIGLFGLFTLQALDTTIIASAFPYIASEFSAYSSSLSLSPPAQSKRTTNSQQMRSSS